MRTIEQLKGRLEEYKGAVYVYTDKGYIAWQYSTGENVELLFIEVAEQRKGYGRELVKLMCDHIKPYNSVFVIRMAENDAAGQFYRKLGFEETTLKGLYKDKDAVMGIADYKTLCQSL